MKRQTAAYEARQTAEAEAWTARLSQEERSAILGILGSTMRIPDEVVLRRHFRSEIWPKMQREESLTQNHEQEVQ